MKKRMNKKGLSIMISYALLISFAIIISAVVYLWLSKYVPREGLNCPDGVSIYVSDSDCDIIISNLILNIKNNGRFSFDGYFIYATNNSNQELATIDLSPNLISGGSNFTKAILFNPVIEPNSERTSVFKLNNKIYSIDIVPVKYQKVDNRMRFVQCGNSRITEKVDCSLNPLRMSGLVSWWKFEGNADDEKGGNNGDLINDTNCDVNGASSKTGKSCSFDGSGDYINLTNTYTIFNFSADPSRGAGTITMWLKSSSQGILRAFIGDFSTNAGFIKINEDSTSNRVSFETSSPDSSMYSVVYENEYPSLDISEWHFYAFVFNGTHMSLHIDGGDVVDPPPQPYTPDYFDINVIGRGYSNNRMWNGTIDEVMIFNRTLSQTEIKLIYDEFK